MQIKQILNPLKDSNDMILTVFGCRYKKEEKKTLLMVPASASKP